MARTKKKSNKKLKAILISQVILLRIILGALAVYFFGGYATKIKELRVEADQLVKDSTEETFRA